MGQSTRSKNPVWEINRHVRILNFSLNHFVISNDDRRIYNPMYLLTRTGCLPEPITRIKIEYFRIKAYHTTLSI